MEPTLTMTGHAGHTPALRVSRHGTAFTRFRLAHTTRIPGEDGWVNGHTSWVTVVCFGDMAKNVAECVRKGDPLVVTGRARVERWEDDEKGQRESLTIEARSVGHDLRLGTSKFTRVLREKPKDETTANESVEPMEPVETIDDDDELTTQRVDPRTGELLSVVEVPDDASDLVEEAPF